MFFRKRKIVRKIKLSSNSLSIIREALEMCHSQHVTLHMNNPECEVLSKWLDDVREVRSAFWGLSSFCSVVIVEILE